MEGVSQITLRSMVFLEAGKRFGSKVYAGKKIHWFQKGNERSKQIKRREEKRKKPTF